MCGIIGVIGPKDLRSHFYIGLLALQHRGQDACGIITNDKDKFFMTKDLGTVDKVLSKENLKRHEGNIGIGHVRYPTIGDNFPSSAQPYMINSTKKVGMAHNGNVVNYFDLKEKLKRRGVFLVSNVDVEPMVQIFGYHYERTDDIFYSVERLYEEVVGAYSAVAVIENQGLLGFRDPHGFKPLVLGKKEESYILASESVVLQALGYEYVRDVKPGEAVFIDQNMKVTSKIIKEKPNSHCMFEWVYFARPDSLIEERSVYNARLKLGSELAKKFNKEVDVVIPVPDTARTAAVKFSEEIGVKYREGLIKNRYIGRTFIMDSQKKRKSSVLLKLNPLLSAIKDKKVALVDDSIVRGTTGKAIIKMLRNNGAKEVHLLSTCPPIRYPCFYGIDFATSEELIASNKTIEEIRKYMDADSLTYLDIESLKKALKMEDVCLACLNGDYPTEITETQKNKLALDRHGIKQNILLIGSGGREHTMAWKIKQSNLVDKLYCIPGNAGIAEIAECHDIDIMDNDALIKFVKENNIELTVVGPEAPLVNGIVDEFQKQGLRIFGPNKNASMLEGSKSFAKGFMKKYNISTADYAEFTDYEKASEYIQEKQFPLVIKADGLAAGKGVMICNNLNEAKLALQEMQRFGEASSKIVVEEFLEGEELSYLAFLDGNTFKPMVTSQDHKRVNDNDLGPNTGGMGAYSPVPVAKGHEQELNNILKEIMQGLKQENIDYKGILYVGLMKTNQGFKVLEFNCRFGDPETQVILPRLDSDLVEIMQHVVDQKLDTMNINWKKESAACIVLASGGYPLAYEKGKFIYGLSKVHNMLFHAGTKKIKQGLITDGGRVLGIVALGNTIKESIEKAYADVRKIAFDNMHFRNDIGRKALKNEIYN